MKRVLIVEDMEMTERLLTQTIASLPHFESGSVDCLEAVRSLCGRDAFPYDCALLDLQIYEKAAVNGVHAEKAHTDWGIEALNLLVQKIAKERIIILSLYAPILRKKLEGMGYGDQVHGKPIATKKLIKCLRKMFPEEFD